MKTTFTRNRGNEPTFDPVISKGPLLATFNSFAKFELGFGGIVTDFNETSITTVTRVMSCIDTTVFEGTPEEMVPFFKLAAAHAGLLSTDEALEMITAHAFNFLETATGRKGGGVSPLICKLGGDIIMGGISLKMALILAFDLGELATNTADELLEAAQFIIGGENKEKVIGLYKK